jgi:hypothetical protein
MFADIRAKQFIQIPAQVEQAPSKIIQVPVQITQELAKPNPLGIKIVEEQPEQLDPKPVHESPTKEPTQIAKPSLNKLINTKFNQGAMIGNPNPQTAKEVVIAPGGTFSFGSEDK